jgi:NAD-dependent DNA ligase adenylation domain
MFLPVEWVNRRQRQILVHSFLYYQLDTSIIADHIYDLWCKQLAVFMKENPEIAKQSFYYEAFKEFDGSSGYDLPFTIPHIQSTGYKLLKIHEKRKLK